MEADAVKMVNGMFDVLEKLFPKGDAIRRVELAAQSSAENSTAEPTPCQ